MIDISGDSEVYIQVSVALDVLCPPIAPLHLSCCSRASTMSACLCTVSGSVQTTGYSGPLLSTVLYVTRQQGNLYVDLVGTV